MEAYRHHDSFDLKPEAPDDIRGKYKSIDTVVPGLKVGEKLPLMAKVMDRLTLFRSGAHSSDHHETAASWVLSGRFRFLLPAIIQRSGRGGRTRNGL